MPVNMDPSKKRRKPPTAKDTDEQARVDTQDAPKASGPVDDGSDRDREHALADAEWKNLWDATEVIDMDRW